jgi:hypothetical protein
MHIINNKDINITINPNNVKISYTDDNGSIVEIDQKNIGFSVKSLLESVKTRITDKKALKTLNKTIRGLKD